MNWRNAQTKAKLQLIKKDRLPSKYKLILTSQQLKPKNRMLSSVLKVTAKLEFYNQQQYHLRMKVKKTFLDTCEPPTYRSTQKIPEGGQTKGK